ncbi:hypothetical protein EUBVEN_00026, partial [Eubacterium ventriosum ATCC 27560]
FSTMHPGEIEVPVKMLVYLRQDGKDPMELYSSLILGFDIACTG